MSAMRTVVLTTLLNVQLAALAFHIRFHITPIFYSPQPAAHNFWLNGIKYEGYQYGDDDGKEDDDDHTWECWMLMLKYSYLRMCPMLVKACLASAAAPPSTIWVFISLILSYLLPQQSECLILSLLTAIKGCLSEFGLFDEHFQVNRLLFKYWR